MTWDTIAAGLVAGTRVLVLIAAAATSLVALTHWAVRQKHLSPFGALPRLVRRWSDPIIRPLERRMVRWGRNPQDAPLWLLGVTVVAGILLLSLMGWATGWISELLWLQQAGASGWAQFLVSSVTQLLLLAILVRVIGSWVGATDYTPWMRPFVLLTEWLVGPIRRRLPPMGPLDLSPIVAYFVLILARAILFVLIP